MKMKTASSKERTRGSNQIRKVQRSKGEFWGYDVWLRQPDGKRTRYREFSFSSKAEAGQALAALKTSGWKARYGLKPPPTVAQTTISSAIASYLKVAKANLAANRTDDSKYWRNMPGHMRTLERWGEFAGLERHVSTIQSDDFVFWMAAEMERGKTNRQALKKATIRRPRPNHLKQRMLAKILVQQVLQFPFPQFAGPRNSSAALRIRGR